MIFPIICEPDSGEEGETKKADLPGRPITVFHSYKGGVGRTLALISLVREMSEAYGSQKKCWLSMRIWRRQA